MAPGNAALPTFNAACKQAAEAGASGILRFIEKAEGKRTAFVTAIASGKARRALEGLGWVPVAPVPSDASQPGPRSRKRPSPSAPVTLRLAVNPDVPYDPDIEKRLARQKAREQGAGG